MMEKIILREFRLRLAEDKKEQEIGLAFSQLIQDYESILRQSIVHVYDHRYMDMIIEQFNLHIFRLQRAWNRQLSKSSEVDIPKNAESFKTIIVRECTLFPYDVYGKSRVRVAIEMHRALLFAFCIYFSTVRESGIVWKESTASHYICDLENDILEHIIEEKLSKKECKQLYKKSKKYRKDYI